MAKEFKYQTPEEIDALPAFTEQEPDETDGGKSPYREGYVYFVTKVDNDNAFKIGLTGNPEQRRKNLQTAQPEKLNMICEHVSVMKKVENDILEAMKEEGFEQAEGGKEWFYGDVEEAQELFMRIIEDR